MVKVWSAPIFRSIRYWLVLLFFAVLSVAVLAVYVFAVQGTGRRLVDERLARLSESAPLIQQTLYASLRPDARTGRIIYDSKAVEQQVRYLDSQLDARIVVLDAEGAVAVDSRGTPAFVLSDYPLLKRSPPASTSQAGTATVLGSSYAYVVVPVSRPGMGVVSQIIVTSGLSDVARAVATVNRQLLLAAGLAAAVAVVTTVVASWLISGRLRRIERGAGAMADGDFGLKIPVAVADEIGRLAQSFNAMGTQLGTLFAQLATEKERIDLLLSELAEGVVAVSASDAVVVANPSAGGLLGVELPRGALLRRCLPPDLLTPIELCLSECRATGRTAHRRLDRGKSSLEMDAYVVAGQEELDTILIVRDVTEQARLERARRDFAANASHELKTPLFSLAGFLELLTEQELDRETRQRFLALARQQTTRLTALSARLLDLSRLDSGVTVVQKGEADMVEIARQALADYETVASEKRVRLDLETDRQRLPIVCDRAHVAHILSILLDNAVKASPDGGRVAIVVCDDTPVCVRVTDEGPGVTREELDRIFERFYRSASSPAASGSGLGLAIARELATAMGGQLVAEATDGHGGSFRLTLPCA